MESPRISESLVRFGKFLKARREEATTISTRRCPSVGWRGFRRERATGLAPAWRVRRKACSRSDLIDGGHRWLGRRWQASRAAVVLQTLATLAANALVAACQAPLSCARRGVLPPRYVAPCPCPVRHSWQGAQASDAISRTRAAGGKQELATPSNSEHPAATRSIHLAKHFASETVAVLPSSLCRAIPAAFATTPHFPLR